MEEMEANKNNKHIAITIMPMCMWAHETQHSILNKCSISEAHTFGATIRFLFLKGRHKQTTSLKPEKKKKESTTAANKKFYEIFSKMPYFPNAMHFLLRCPTNRNDAGVKTISTVINLAINPNLIGISW